MMAMNYLEGAEKFYDLFGFKDDIEFYTEQAKRYGGKALELGVGTARLAIELAKAGIETWGIDNSRHMLNAAEMNMAKLPAEVQGLLHLELADVRSFDLDERFGLVYFPSGSFDHLLKRDDQVAALKNIRKHIAPGGAYAFDLYLVTELKADRGWFVQRRPLEGTRMVVRMGYHVTRPEERLMSLDMWYELYEDGRMLERYHEGNEVYIHDIQGIQELLEETGFKITERYGGHDKRPFEGGDFVVLVAKPVD